MVYAEFKVRTTNVCQFKIKRLFTETSGHLTGFLKE